MHSILTVNTAATSYDLTTLAAVKAELGITGTDEDTAITAWITQASQAAALYCNRVFAEETVTETFRDSGHVRYGQSDKFWQRPREAWLLARNPVTAVASVVEDDTALVQGTDYEFASDGVLYRLSNGYARHWRFYKSLVVRYTAGFPGNATPVPLARSAISLVKLLRASATRDPALRSENILSGLYSYTLFNSTEFPSGIPADVEALLAPYRNITI